MRNKEFLHQKLRRIIVETQLPPMTLLEEKERLEALLEEKEREFQKLQKELEGHLQKEKELF